MTRSISYPFLFPCCSGCCCLCIFVTCHQITTTHKYRILSKNNINMFAFIFINQPVTTNFQSKTIMKKILFPLIFFIFHVFCFLSRCYVFIYSGCHAANQIDYQAKQTNKRNRQIRLIIAV